MSATTNGSNDQPAMNGPVDALSSAKNDGAGARPGGPQDSLEAQLPALPAQPGVYILKDPQGRVMYVGKAKNLRTRVRTYLRGGDERSQVRFLMRRVSKVDTLVTANDKEALILENNLIKQYKPRYNIRLKDDKTYLSAKVTLGDPWPRILVTRRIVKDGSRYFGPFSSAYAVRRTLDTIRKVFPLRSCTDAVFRNRSRPCLEYQIRRCLGPCCLPVDRQEYERHLQHSMQLLQGKDAEVVDELRSRMLAASHGLRFEEAARLRDQVRAVEQTIEPQRMVSHGGGDRDVIGLYREGGFIEVQVLFVRQGKLTGSQGYSLDDWELPDEEVVAAILTQYYQGSRYAPDEILIPFELEDGAAREEYLSEHRGRAVRILAPQRGDRARLVVMAAENARQSFAARRDSEARSEKMLLELQRRLHLRHVPKRIECFDISNIQGTNAVGSMVVFDQGEADKDSYRRFRIRTVEGADDFAMMYEVLMRRYRRGLEENDLPDLLVVDGGKGQLNVALRVLGEIGVSEVDAIGLAKARVERAPRESELRRKPELVFLPGRKNPVILHRTSTALFLLQRIRDEAHRFAITYHKKLRQQAELASPLDGIPGVGLARRRALIRRFGSAARLRQAGLEDIASVPGITETLARRILDHLALQR
jgi:excinuclease ABC subunit C